MHDLLSRSYSNLEKTGERKLLDQIAGTGPVKSGNSPDFHFRCPRGGLAGSARSPACPPSPDRSPRRARTPWNNAALPHAPLPAGRRVFGAATDILVELPS